MIDFYQRKDKVFAFDEDIFTHFRVAKIYWDNNRFKLKDYIKIHRYFVPPSGTLKSMYFNIVFLV